MVVKRSNKVVERPIDQWNRLRGVGEGDGALEVPSLSSGVETGFGPIRFAIGPRGEPRLMVPCGTGTAVHGPRANGNLSVTLSRYDVSGSKVLFVDVMCINRALDTVFAELANEVVHRIADGRAPADAVDGTIADFRDLLKNPASPEIPDERIVGLIGELLVLQRLVGVSPRAVESWTGPHEQRHDFRRGNRAIEVKTSSRADAALVTISSSEQLAVPDGGSLLLVHVKIERADGGALNVKQLVSNIADHGAQSSVLKVALAALGCEDATAPEWNRLSYALESISGYRVEPGFPRITPGQFADGRLPDGIRSLAYSVDLRSARDFRLAQGDLDAALVEFAS